MPLLQRAELLQRQRVDRAEHRQRALGGAQPLLLLLADERARSPAPRSVGLGGAPLVGARRPGSLRSTGTGWSGPYSATSASRVEAELLERALLELLDPHLLLGAGHLVAVDGVDELVVLAGQVAQPGADGEQLLLAALAGPLDLRAGRCGPADRDVEPVEHVRRPRRRPPGPPRPSRSSRARALDLAGAGLALVLGGAQQLVGPAVQGARPLLGGAQREPGLHLALAGTRGRPRRAARASSVDLLESGSSSARASRASRSPSPARSLVAGLLGLGDRPLEPLGLAAGGAGLGAELAELLGHRGQGGVGLVQLGERDVDPLLGLVPLALQPGHVEAEPLARGDRLGQLLRRPRRPRPGSRCRLGWLAEPPAAK